MKHKNPNIKPNRNKALKFAGLLSKSEAKILTAIINKEFSKIEGKW
jgi:hypothetical protein